MKVRIVKCSGKEYWYKNSVGEVFDVITPVRNGFYYELVRPGWFVDIEDAEVVKESQPDPVLFNCKLPSFPLPDGDLFIGTDVCIGPLSGYSTDAVIAYSNQLIEIINGLQQELTQCKQGLTQATEQQISKIAALLRKH